MHPRRPSVRLCPFELCVLCCLCLRQRGAALLPFVLTLAIALPVHAGVQYSFSFDVPLSAQTGPPDLPATTFLFSGKFLDTDINTITQQVSTFEDLSLTVADLTLSNLLPAPEPTLDLTGVVLPPAAGTIHPSVLGPNTSFTFTNNPIPTLIRAIDVLDTHIHREYSVGTLGPFNTQDVNYSDSAISITNLSPSNTSVPEPSTLVIVGAGLLWLGARVLCRSRSNAANPGSAHRDDRSTAAH